MCYRFAALSLAATLGVLPGLTTLPAAPAPPAKAKPPAIYALVYVGLGKNDPDNAKRITTALQALRGSATGAVRDPKVNALAIVQEKERKLGWIERDKWAESKTRTANLEGTAVVRVWFTDGSPQEQVAIVNAIARDYVENQQEIFRDALKELKKHEARFKAQKKREGLEVTEKEERIYRRQEEAIKHLPQVIEWATLPEKP